MLDHLPPQTHSELISYSWTAFFQQPESSATATVDRTGNLVFAIVAVVLVVLAARAVRRRQDVSAGTA